MTDELVIISKERAEAVAKWFLKYHTPVEDHVKIDQLWDEWQGKPDELLGGTWLAPMWRDAMDVLEAAGITIAP